MTNAHEWLKATCGDDSFREIARRAGLSDSIISRQLNSGAFSFDVAISIAREYETSVLAALVANGHITNEEAGMSTVEAALQSATDAQVVLEVSRRLDVSPSSLVWDSPVSDAAARADATVHHVDFGAGIDDERAVASERHDDPNDSDEHFID